MAGLRVVMRQQFRLVGDAVTECRLERLCDLRVHLLSLALEQ